MARNLGIPCADNRPYYFISYNSEDDRRVAEYVKAMSGFNVPLWYDSGIKTGQAWEKEIADRIQDGEAVIMFLSKNIFKKENSYVHVEYELATLHFDKSIYVVLLDDIKNSDVPNRFKIWWVNVTRFQCINASEFASPYECMKKLLENIGIADRFISGDKDSDCGSEPDNTKENESIQKKSVQIPYEVKKQNEEDNVSSVGELVVISRRLQLSAKTYALSYNGELDEYISWMFCDRRIDCERIYHSSRALMTLSRMLMDMKISAKPIYNITDRDEILMLVKIIKSNSVLKEKDNYVNGLYSYAIDIYSEFLARNTEQERIESSPLPELDTSYTEITDKELTKMLIRLRMNARTYSFELSDELNDFIRWLVYNCGLGYDIAYQYSRALLTVSGILIDKNICSETIYQIDNADIIFSILVKFKTNYSLIENDKIVNELYSTALNHYYKFLSEK